MRQRTGFLAWTAVAVLIVAGGCQGKDEAGSETATTDTTAMDTGLEPAAPAAEAVQVTLEAANDADFSGTATFTQEGTAVRLVADLSGIDTPGKHGFHIHEHGTCDAHDAFKSAGSHWNPDNAAHACPPTEPRHAGDLGNIEVGPDGAGHFEALVEGLTVSGGDHGIGGHALMLHAGDDDCATQPTGDAGDRLACGVIGGEAAAPPATTDAPTSGGGQ